MARHIHADVIHAFAEGASIQCKMPEGNGWEDHLNPLWYLNAKYRVKPEHAEDIVEYWADGGKDKIFKCTCIQLDGKNKHYPQIKVIRDGETNKIKSAEVIK